MHNFNLSTHRRIEDRIVCYFVPSLNRKGAVAREKALMKLKLTDALLLMASAPLAAWSQQSSKVTKADAQKVLKIISSDKAKTRIYCQMARLGDQMEQANEQGDSKKFDQLFQRMYELGKKLGPEYA